jgi:hypothetical protein
MKTRVAEAFYDVWVNRCRELCRGGAEFGGATGLFNTNWIRFARPKDSPDRIVGVFHIKVRDHNEVELVLEDHYSPPRRIDSLGRGYRELAEHAEDYQGKCVFLPPDVFA